MPTKTLKTEDLSQFTGSEHWYQHGLVRSITYTDGAKYVADAGGAYWLLDEIALAQRFDRAVRAEPFQVWTLFTDFPLPEIKFYFTDNVILLPSEY